MKKTVSDVGWSVDLEFFFEMVKWGLIFDCLHDVVAVNINLCELI
jgi:hypothetical protein